jgi:hypothetical protein
LVEPAGTDATRGTLRFGTVELSATVAALPGADSVTVQVVLSCGPNVVLLQTSEEIPMEADRFTLIVLELPL